MITTESIWDEYYERLLSFIRRRVDDDVADDLLQDVFVKIHIQISSLKENAKLESWLYQITRNTIIDYYRSKRTMEELPNWIKQPQPDEDEIIRRELPSCLEPMIRQLPDKYQKAIQLSEIDRGTQKEIAILENISLSGAKSRVQRGRALLKTMLHDCCKIEVNRNNQLVSYDPKERECKPC